MPERRRIPQNLVGQRIEKALTESGAKKFMQEWDEAVVEKAWKLVADSYPEWSDYLENRQSLPGGLEEMPIEAGEKTVGWAFIGLKNLDRPDGWRYGIIGFDNALLPLGYFPNKI